MIQILLAIDTQLTQIINSIIPHNSFFDLFFSFLSMKGGSIAIWIAIVLFLIIFEGKRHHKFIITFCVAVLITALLVNVVIKNIVRRPRPSFAKASEGRPVSTNSCPKDFSFPSGHASTAFAAATVISFYDKRRRWFYCSIAGLIAFSRVYLGCHYFLDVLMGGIIGYVISFSLQTFPYTSPFRRKN